MTLTGQPRYDITRHLVAGEDPDSCGTDQMSDDTQCRAVGAATILPADQERSDTHGEPIGGEPSCGTDQGRLDPQTETVGAATVLPADQIHCEPHWVRVGGEHSCGTDQVMLDTQVALVAAATVHPADHSNTDTHRGLVGGDPSCGTDQPWRDTQRNPVGAASSPPADQRWLDTQICSVGGDPSCGTDQSGLDAQPSTVGAATILPADQRRSDAQGLRVGGEPSCGTDQYRNDTQGPLVGAATVPPADHGTLDPHSSSVGGGLFAEPNGLLLVAADVLDDIEKARTAATNRLQALTTPYTEGANGGGYGKNLPADHPAAVELAALVKGLFDIEHAAELALGRAMRAHPLGAWVKATKGVGEKQGARLIATLGDPYWNGLHNRPRTISELWAYCGYHPIDGVAARRKKGQRANWSIVAKMRAFLVADKAVQVGVRKLSEPDDSGGYDLTAREAITPLGAIYLNGRAQYADAVHVHPCPQCGPKGKPAEPGSPLSTGHQHARARRLVAKDGVLKGLWLEAKRIHEEA